MQSHNNQLEQFHHLLSLFEKDVNSAKERSQVLFSETKQVFEELALVIKDDQLDCNLRLFFAEIYSTKIHGFKYRYFVEKFDSAVKQKRSGTAMGCKENPANAKLHFFSDVTSAQGYLHNLSHDNSIALAVIGGNHFRRMCGKNLPKYFLAQDVKNTNSPRAYRVAEGIENFIEWFNFNKLNPNLPIFGFFINFIIAYYFGDGDMRLNFGFIEGKDHYITTRIDPEHCYSQEFEEQSVEDIFEHLSFFYKSSTVYKPERIAEVKDENDDEEKVLKIYGDDDNVPDFFISAMDCPAFLNIEIFQKLFFSPQRNRELFIALAIILDTPPSELWQDVESVLGPKKSSFKDFIAHFQKERYKNFKEAAYQLDGFRDYYESKAYLQDEIYQIYKCDNVHDNNNNNNNKNSSSFSPRSK